MADSINPNASKNTGASFLPRIYRSDANKKFLQATIDQLTQPGTVKKINGYIGRQNAKATTSDDIFLAAPSKLRQDYQLEPGLVVNDNLGNTTFFKDYQDYINQVSVFGGNIKNHARLNEQEFYSWDPHIDWDKFVNFQNYYWLPYGPDVIKIAGQQEAITSTYEVIVEDQLDSNAYIFSPKGSVGLVRNPTITLFRGQTYIFEINSPGNPFSIKTSRTSGTLDLYEDQGIDNQFVEVGTITFTVPYNCPDVLYYVSETDIDLGGIFEVLSITENTSIDVEAEILGKKTYTLPDGTSLSNGMKVAFIGNVTPVSYASSQYYVEGVGDSIKLVDEKVLELVSPYTESQSILFDSTPFDSMPFSDATAYPGALDYIVINRSSMDHNPWSRYNRWFHKDVIETSAIYNGKVPSIDQSKRAVRPIVEFEPDLKLYNFGTRAVVDVDLVDTYTTDVFSTIEGQLGYNVDNIPLAQGQRILFTADTDRLVKNNIYRVEFRLLAGVRQIHLVLETEPVVSDVVLVKQGKQYQGQMFWFNGNTWNQGQQKTKLNQPPLFDIFDANGVSYGDLTVYDGSTFRGTPIFSYKVGTGSVDSNLGFSLSYKNINNIGDIVFNFNLANDFFIYKDVTDVVTQQINVGYLLKTLPTFAVSYRNGWQQCTATTTQAAVRIYKNTNKTNNFDLDIFDDITDLTDLVVRVYINGIRLESSNWTLVDGVVYKKLILNSDITTSDVLTVRAFAKQPINNNGYYEIPVNLQNNPLNSNLQDFTLGEVIDHVNSIVDNLTNFSGVFPGAGNVRDLGNVTQYGTKFVQHSGPMSLALYHLTSEDNNIVRAIEKARDDYNKFKRNFITIAGTLGVDAAPEVLVDLILEKINKDKPKTYPYYFSDMVPYGASIKTNISVVDSRIKTYPLTDVFTLDKLSFKAVGVYLNGTQLLHEHQYTFSDQGFVVINDSVDLQVDDVITIYEYDNTNGSFVPPTPSKLGIWPTYDPQIYVDTSYLTPRTMIQGHDGSQILAYGDYRDDVILELEKRIYNNIKVSYDPSVFNIHDIIPGYNRTTPYSLEEFNEVLAPHFYSWTSLIDRDFTKPLSYDRNNPMTFNYRGHSAPDGRETPGYWRGVYRWLLDTDRPNISPWEMLGFTDEPTWWTTIYGPAPYTSDNLVMWKDLADGIVREPGKVLVKKSQYARPYLIDHIPVDDQGNVISPLMSGLSEGIITTTTSGDFVFGDVSPVESAWRRSSFYPFSVLLAAMVLQPAKTFGTLLDRSRVVRNLAGQLVYSDTGLRITPADVKLPSIYSSTSSVQTAGIINYVVDYILSDNLKSYDSYSYDLLNIAAKLSHRIGAFTSKEKFNLLLDSKTPLSQSSVFVPQENYNIILNTSSPVKKITYSGVIITKLEDGFDVKGYSKTQPYFKYYAWIRSGANINVGGISESYSIWTAGVQYAVGKIVQYGGKYYRSIILHTTSTSFDSKYYQPLPQLPIIGGRDATLRSEWDRTEVITVPYGTKFTSIQEVVDFLLGYGEWLKDQGFIFDDFNNTMAVVTNWETSAKEFLFWTTQNWSSGEDKWTDWLPNTLTAFGSIVRYNGDYYRAVVNSEPSEIFIENDFVKLDGLSTVGSSVISLSPSAAKLSFSTPLCVVDDIRNPFNNYEIFKVDGSPIQPNFLNSYREDNAVTYIPQGEDGIYGATFYLVQKEQVVVLDNSTMFNDTIYHPASGYRQERIKVSGYISTGWYGAFDVPGFIFDQAKIEEWEGWKDYSLGDIVKYKEFYYSAKTFLAGTEAFNHTDWVKLDTKPTAQLLPNWTYKAEQFTDFYSLDSDNFDPNQQSVAQHLVGYQKRQYLSNIIKNDVSEFKFYQGMIIEKGTQNVFNKLFDVLSADNQESLTFFEEWAVRVGQYGASESFDNIEFALDEAEFKTNPQGIELVNEIDSSKIDFIYRQTPNDVYLKPLGYNNNPWPLVKNYIPYLRSPGYVRENEVNVVLGNISEILTKSVDSFRNGDYIWCGFEGPSWNVYRYSDADIIVTEVTYNSVNKQVTITSKNLVNLSAGDIIGINQTGIFDGFFVVNSVSLNAFTINIEIQHWSAPFTAVESVIVFKLTSQRATSVDTISDVVPSNIRDGELVWTDNNGQGKWSVWEYNKVYSSSEIANSNPQDLLRFGKQVLVNNAGNITIVSNDLGELVVYDKASPASGWLQRQTILPPFIARSGLTTPTPDSYNGNVLAVSADGRWLAAGTPNATNVSSYFVGPWVSLMVVAAGDIVTHDSKVYKCISSHTAGGTFDPLLWKQIPYIPVNVDADNSDLVNQGVISIYEKDKNNIFTLVDTILSPYPADSELFGSSLSFGNNVLLVGATGYSSNTGRVYQLEYSTKVEATAFYNPIISTGTTITVSTTTGIEVGMTVVGTGFTSGQTVIDIIDETTLVVSDIPDSEPSGVLNFTLTGWRYTPGTGLSATVSAGSNFGSVLSMSNDSSTLLVSSISTEAPGKVFVYKNTSGSYVLTQTLLNGDVGYGISTTVSTSGDYIAISSVLADREKVDQGTVLVYRTSITGYNLYQELANRTPESAQFFGTGVSFMNDFDSLVVYSQNADTVEALTLTDGTTFDNELTSFYLSKTVNGGRVDVYDRYSTKWVFSESLENLSGENSSYGAGFAVGANHILVSAPYAKDPVGSDIASGKVYEYNKPNNTYSWSTLHVECDKPDVTKIKKAFLYNKFTNKLVTYLDVVDPAQGKIPGIADQEIKYKTFYDPATYSVGTSSVNVDDGLAWTTNQVGMLWWDLRTAKFIESYDTELVYKNSTWNTLFPGASIDVNEWVESKLLPADWDALADTEEGIARGISGTSVYGNNVYSVVRKYDNISKSFKNTYYYWVKNKKTIPNVQNRYMSAQDVANMIENPRGEGYQYLALTGSNSFSLVNVKPLLEDANVVLSVEYWITDNIQQNVHSQWKLISNNEITNIPTNIEEKWFDSLCGKDSDDRVVPDMTLPIKLRYGIENRPRQGMFINRFEALKQLIEQVNRVLIQYQIVEQRDVSALDSYEAAPSMITCLYDATIDTDAELRLVSPTPFARALVTPIITDGRITSVNITNKGRGYLNNSYITVTGPGTGAVLKTVINASGQVTSVEVLSSGEGYVDGETFLTVRNYAVLVKSDSAASGAWSIYSYEPTTRVWSRTRTQAYDTRKYRSYVDWYADGYNQFTAVDYSVETFADLNTIEVAVGKTVKVRTTNSGNWMMLEKYADSSSVDWTQSYKVVGNQNGTVQFSSVLYQFLNTTYGYDGSLYDSSIFDNSASKELRVILNTLKNNILVDDLKSTYLDLFFTSVRYALSEQNYLDWIFKTSFVKAQHNVGELKEKVTYNNDNLADFEQYVAEVKPYRTKIREYVSSYSKLDTSASSVTDFDLPPVFDGTKLMPITTTVENGVIVADTNAITTYPWKHWLDNVGFEIVELAIVDGGTDYLTEPVVRFVSDSGTGAQARALIANGKVNRVVLLNPGKGYLSAPTVIIDGGLAPEGTAARVVAKIGNGVVRSNLVRMKFDRITQSYFITQLQETETFTGTGSRVQFPLKWAPDVRIGKSSVTVGGVNILRSDYKLAITKSTARGYTSYSGTITFNTAPAAGKTVSVTYVKDWSVLNAADRIQYFYNPATGELGKDLAQLMTGIDYGGVIVNGLGFDVSAGWDSLPFYSDKWDSYDATFDDYIVTVAANTHSFTLPYIPAKDTEINVYYVKLNVESYISNGTDLIYYFNVEDIYPPKVTVSRDVAVSSSTNNVAGSYILTVASTTGVKVGDVLTITPTVANAVGYNTRVVEIVNSTDVRLDQILFKNISAGHTATFTRELVVPTDLTINQIGSIVLTSPITAGSVITITSTLAPMRIDDVNYGTVDQTNENAVMATWIADGESNTVEIPGTFTVNAGDQFILRKSTSDGSIKPQEADYDTALSGGDLAYSSATGLAAEDIILDGDSFVTPTSSPAPEEVVPGQVVDAVAIKVFDKPSSGSANIKVDNYIADGIEDTFALTQLPNSPQAVIVKTTTGTRDPVTGELTTTVVINLVTEEYIVDYKNRLVTFVTPPEAGSLVSLYSIGFSGSNILDIDYFVGDGTTLEFITKAPALADVSYVVYVNGFAATVEAFVTDSSYDTANLVGFRFADAPATGDLVTFVVVSGADQTFAITSSERIAATGALTYDLQNIVGSSLPIESSMIVRVDQEILNGPNNIYFTITGSKVNYTIDSTKYLPYSISVLDLVVLADGNLLQPVIDYTVDLSGITIKITQSVRKKYLNKSLIVSVKTNEGYIYLPPTDTTPPQIAFSKAYPAGSLIEVISSYKHDILDIQRTTASVTSSLTLTPDTKEFYQYTGLSGGRIPLDRTVIDDSYIWVVKNGKLLTPSVDYKLNADRQSITLASSPTQNDEFTLITYGSNVITSGIAYMQFKDMLNRVHYKRLSLNKQTRLVKDLRQTDTTIEVEDASTFDLPSTVNNKPGVIEIHGERIEYFTVNGNILGQLRRGTLGTSVPAVHRAGVFVQELGPSETIPYSDSSLVENIISDGTNIVNLKSIPTKDSTTTWTYNSGFVSSIPAGYGQSNDIEVFANGVRLKKKPYTLYNVANHPESTEGDVQYDAEFSVNGTSNHVRLTTPVNFGTYVTVVKKTGTDWDGKVTSNILYDDNKIARFLKASPGIWYSSNIKYGSASVAATFDSASGTFDSTSITFDQG